MTHYKLTIHEQTFEVEIGAVQGGSAQVIVNQVPYTVRIDGADRSIRPLSVASAASLPAASAGPMRAAAPRTVAGAGIVTAPIPGKILQLRVQVGERVKSGQTVAIMEAMKMENDILSPMAGTVKEIRVAPGTDVATGDVILIIG